MASPRTDSECYPMRALKLTMTIDSSRRIVLQLPADTPEGEVEIIILVEEDEKGKEAAKGEVLPAGSLRSSSKSRPENR